MASPQGSVSGGCGKFRTRSNVVCAMSSSASLCARSAALASACSTTEVDITQMYPKLRILDLKSWDQNTSDNTIKRNSIIFFHSRRFSTHLKKVIFWGVVVNGWERGLTDRKGRSRKVHGSFTVVSRYHFPHKYCHCSDPIWCIYHSGQGKVCFAQFQYDMVPSHHIQSNGTFIEPHPVPVASSLYNIHTCGVHTCRSPNWVQKEFGSF